MCRRGPMVENHDAFYATGDACALFGFLGVASSLQRDRALVLPD